MTADDSETLPAGTCPQQQHKCTDMFLYNKNQSKQVIFSESKSAGILFRYNQHGQQGQMYLIHKYIMNIIKEIFSRATFF